MEMKKMMIIAPLIYLSKSWDMTDPSVLYPLRAAFSIVMFLELSLWIYIYAKAKSNNDKTTIKVKEEQSPFTQEPPKEYDSTVSEYDMTQVKKCLTQVVMLCGVIGFIHYKFEAAAPLLIQLMLRPLAAFDHQLFKAYIRGQNVTRPFPEPESPFSAFKKLQQSTSDEQETENERRKPRNSE